ncbi:hypothetical protein Rvan_2394 [Rhodomicrobium vannielii ATCC 17100]|uniref:Uncharacterized protein n=1 Tax=Rhodomicrobium vannielii (strain ATCC 17100 / DSM 162 / LMG 4299 / NCIMB 10020 / ATH 3.1.1) TaxID=648757 RepID=E3I4N6_RHOVT|nr:hypothetical protein [Rhodomicrobium vannielii]ADP71618.1 hypothetical protein Rvan_2394 [Rhodomicrobium vannielii ATCC 17100]
MSHEFDASLIHPEPAAEALPPDLRNAVESAKRMPSAFANAKLHGENELRRLVQSCNRIAWGTVPSDLRAPSREEAEALLAALAPDVREKLLAEAKLAAEQRRFVGILRIIEREVAAQKAAEQADRVRYEAEQREIAEFEAFDAAGKAARFEAWRASRRGA